MNPLYIHIAFAAGCLANLCFLLALSEDPIREWHRYVYLTAATICSAGLVTNLYALQVLLCQ